MTFLNRMAALSKVYLVFAFVGISFLFLVIGIAKISLATLIGAMITWVLMIGMLVLLKTLNLRTESKPGTREYQEPPLVAEAIIRSGLPRRFREEALAEIHERYLEILSGEGVRAAKHYYWFEARSVALYLLTRPIQTIFWDVLLGAVSREDQRQKGHVEH